jgi:hypothetical protein
VRLGRDEVVARCAALLSGDDVDLEFVIVLGGAPARRLLASGVPTGQQYWLRVWAVRGLLWSGPSAPSVRHALRDGHWRVREMACKVAARHLMDELIDEVAALESDRNPRVAAAATRAVRRVAASAAAAG